MASTADRIGTLLDAALDALNEGDLAGAHRLAALVLREDAHNPEAGEVLAAEPQPSGEWRRMTLLCCDLVGSTALSERHDPEQYWALVRRYLRMARDTIEQTYEGHIITVKGDGFLALFGYPAAHEDDSRRAVQCGLDLCGAMRQLSSRSESEFGEALDIRVGIHRGLVLVDVDEDEVFGLAANVVSRLEGLAEPGTVVLTENVYRLVSDHYDVTPGAAQTVKGVSDPLQPLTVVGERLEPASRQLATPLVGRASELAVLRSAWAAARDGRGAGATAVLIRGEPGIGKSRLAAAVAEEARGENAVVVELAGSPLHAGAGLHPLRVLLEARCGIHPAMDAAERLRRLRMELAAAGTDPAGLVPLLAPVLGLAPSAGYEPAESEGRKLNEDIAAAACAYLLSCFGGGAGVLKVDDLQWIDESTIALLDALLDRGPAQLLTVLTSREESSLPVSVRIELEPLDPEQSLELIGLLQPDDLEDADRVAIAERSDGIPLYLEELVRAAGEPAPSVDPASGPSGVPDPLYELLVARLLQTGPRAVAGAAATIGREFDRSFLEAVLETPPDELDRGLEALVAGGTILPARRVGSYRFRHELLRGVAYDIQAPSVRRRLHERIATVLVATGSDDLVDWGLVAAHYERAGRAREAAQAGARAADQARRRGALAEARARLGRSIDLIAPEPEDRDRLSQEVAFRLRRGFLAMSAEGVGCPEAAADYERCLELALVDVHGDEMFSSLISLWAYHLSRAELGRAREVLHILRRNLSGSREWFRPANQAGFGMLSWFEGDFATSALVLEDSAASVARAGRPSTIDDFWFVPNDPTTSIYTHLALARYMCGDVRGADEAMAQGVELESTLDFPQGPWSAAYGMWLKAWMLTERGRLDEAGDAAAALVASSIQHGFDSWTMIGLTHRAAIEASRWSSEPGNAEEAASRAAALGEMVELWKSLELLVFLPYYLTVTGAALLAAGDPGAAWKAYQEALELADRTGMRFYTAETIRRLARLEGEAGQADEQLRRALTLARAQGARVFEVRIALDLVERGAPDGIPILEAAVRGLDPNADSADLEAARRLVSAW